MNVYQSKTYLVRDHPFAYATCTNFGDGMGLLQIHSDWGAFSAFWPAMGEGETVEKFVAESEMSYIRGCLIRGLNFQYFKRGAEEQLNRFMIECWPRLARLVEKEQT